MSAIPTPADLRARLLAHPDFASNADRAALVQLLDQQRRYGLAWEDKPEAVEETLRQFLPVLQELPERAINPNQPEVPQHTLIEGDNLHALTVLNYTHAAQVDVIYIDPPYNTGNKDFVYNDRFVDREDGYRHSKWLSFMAKRLKLAKTLLKETGVIFISIDDNEQAQLKLLCDEVFGEENSIGPIIQDKQNAKNDAVNVQKNHEYIFVYRKLTTKNDGKVSPSLINLDLKTREVFEEEGEHYYLNDPITTRGDGGTLNARPTLGHSVYYNALTADLIAVCDYNVELAKTSNDISELYFADPSLISEGYVPIRPPKVRGKLGCWTWSLEKINGEKKNLLVTGKDGSHTIRKRTFVHKDKVIDEGKKMFFVSTTEGNSRSILPYSTNDGTDVLNNILGASGEFNNPKNLEMIKHLVRLVPTSNALILDFFAGSGTTLHATMALNGEDGGSRRCILVTNNENNICEQVTYERNRRVIQGYTTPKGAVVPGLAANSLRYFRCVAPVPRTPLYSHKRELVRRATDMLCFKESCYAPLPGLPAGSEVAGFGSPIGTIVIVYNDLAIEDAVVFIAALPRPAAAPAGQPWCAVYVFAASSYPYTEEFEEVADRVRLSALPDALYRAWQHLLPQEGAMRPLGEPDEASVPVAEPAPAAVHASPEEAADQDTPVEAVLTEDAPKTDKRGNLHLF